MKEYFNFNGVAKRQEFWAVHIVAILVIVVSLVLIEGGDLGALVALVGLVAALWAIVAVVVRRLRDAGLSTWWVLATFAPYVGTVATIVFGCIGSVKQDELISNKENENA